MTELKTLKDLQKEYEWKWDTYNALRQEAIKWAEIFKFRTPNGLYPIDRKTREWIKYFFNLTEEDLK